MQSRINIRSGHPLSGSLIQSMIFCRVKIILDDQFECRLAIEEFHKLAKTFPRTNDRHLALNNPEGFRYQDASLRIFIANITFMEQNPCPVFNLDLESFILPGVVK